MPSADADAVTDEPTAPPPEPLTAPRDGVPDLIDTPTALADAAQRLATAHGPVAVDAERASGYRYGGRAYLVQLRRAGVGTILIDPIPLGDLSPIARALGDAQWVLHAASQDLPCLAEINLRPDGELFDTELGARLAGLERVGLGAVTEHLLGYSLAKEHSAADWSTRPLPTEWLSYAALDVELLVDLRDAVDRLLTEQGKSEWARQEFAAVRDAPAPAPRVDPWRRTSGIHQLRGRRNLAVVRELWTTRDDIARARDVAPGRILPDRAICNAAATIPRSQAELVKLPIFSGPANRRIAGQWLGAINRALALPETSLPETSLAPDGPPPPRGWANKNPAAAARLTAARAEVTRIAAEHNLPAENLITPDYVRRLCWTPPQDTSAAGVAATLQTLGARAWQIGLLADPLSAAVQATDSP